jgi:tetratricopeptide (TPR) repeat protein
VRTAIALVLLLHGAGATDASAQARRPPDRGAMLQRASEALAAGRRSAAAEMFAAAAQQYDSVQALLQLARIRSGDGDGAAALTALRRARVLAPNSEDVLSAFAQVSLATRAIVPAIVALDALTRMCPTVASYQYLLGVGLMQAGDMISAVDALRRAETLEPDRPLTLIALGLAFNNRKMFSEANVPLARALELEPQNIEALAASAEADDGLGQAAAAEEKARRVLASAPAHATANFVLGLVLLRAERYDEAREALLRATASDPLSPRPEYQLSLAYARLGDQANSQKHRDLYEKKLRDVEVRLQELRTRTGIPAAGGMQP